MASTQKPKTNSKSSTEIANREEWLIKATELIREKWFNKPPRVLPVIAVSCGFPRGSSRAIGQCWDPIVSKNGTTHIFICPSLDEPIPVLGTLLHELIHACVGIGEGHGGQFAKMAREVGLQGKLTATFVKPETTLWNALDAISYKLGAYPHKAMLKSHKKKPKKQRMKKLKLVSTEDDQYVVLVSQPLIDEFGYPSCPWGKPMVELD